MFDSSALLSSNFCYLLVRLLLGMVFASGLLAWPESQCFILLKDTQKHHNLIAFFFFFLLPFFHRSPANTYSHTKKVNHSHSMQNVEQLHTSPHRNTSISFSHELPASSGDGCVQPAWTEGDRNRSKCMTLANAGIRGCEKFESTGDSKQQQAVTCCEWLRTTPLKINPY